MTPYAELTYFILIGLLLAPLLLAGSRGKLDGRWTVAATVIVLLVQYRNRIPINAHNHWPELVPLIIFGAYQWGLLRLVLARRLPGRALVAVPLALFPLMVAKWLPLVAPDSKFGFAGISYVTFRALDVLWAVTDGALKEVLFLDYGVFLFFFPTISAGPIDRFKRFKSEWRQARTKQQFWEDFDAGLPSFFRGLLYKFVIATIIERHWLESTRVAPGVLGAIEYAYVYSFYLFFDFAGYSAFAVAVSRWFGVRSPENFNLPWAAQNIRDFWNRWHMSLSFWFRDHVYTRFLLTAVKRKWFKKRETAGSVGYFVSFGLMGLWHGTETFYLLYGFYHALLMSGYDIFSRWKKKHPQLFQGRLWNGLARLITVHAVIFGLWLFSGQAWQGEIPASEFLDQASREAKIGWRGYYRDPAPAPSTDRAKNAFTLGGIMGDAYVAMQAGDTQAFKALQIEAIRYTVALGIGDQVNDALHAAAHLADVETWDSVRQQMVLNQALIAKELSKHHDPDSALLVDLGLWSRLLQVTSSIVVEYTGMRNKMLSIGSLSLLKQLTKEFQELSPALRTSDPVSTVGSTLDYLYTQWSDKGPTKPMVEMTRDKLRSINEQMMPVLPRGALPK